MQVCAFAFLKSVIAIEDFKYFCCTCNCKQMWGRNKSRLAQNYFFFFPPSKDRKHFLRMRGIAAFQLDEIQCVQTNTVHCFNHPVNQSFFPLWHLPAIRFKISPNADMPSFDRDCLSKTKYVLRVSSTNHSLHSCENKKQLPAPPLPLYYLSFSENVNLQKSFNGEDDSYQIANTP